MTKKKYYSLCEYCYQVITENNEDISDVKIKENKNEVNWKKYRWSS